jgi:hypothetical protein
MFDPKKVKLIGFFLVISPLIGYSIYWTLHPSYWFNGDPAAFYLLDSLSIFNGKSYSYVDHPGTPIHVIGTLMLAATYPFFQDTNIFIQFYLTKPIAFFIMCNAFLLVSSIFSVGVLYQTTYSTLKRHRLAGALALATAYFVLHPQSFQSLTLWSHNSLNLPFGTLWLIWLYRELLQEKEISGNKLFLLGFTVGILATSHIYFFTWVASGILIVYIFTVRICQSYGRGVSASLKFLLGSLLGIALMLVPVYKELPRFAAWLIQISTHTGMYGIGETGIFSLDIIAIAIRFWWTTIPLTMILLMTSIITIAVLAHHAGRQNIKIPASIYAMIIGLLVQISLLLILFTKAAVKLRYTLTLASVLPVLLLLVINLFEFVDLRRAKWAGMLYVLLLTSMVITFPQQIKSVLERSYYEEEVTKAKNKAVHRLAEELGIPEHELKVVMAYGTPLKCANMLIASDYTHSFNDEVSALCPNQYGIYDTRIQLNPAQPLVDIRDIQWDLVIWPGNGSDLPTYLESVNAVNIPDSWRVQRSGWYYIHSDTIK